MKGIYTWWIVTCVADVQTFGDGANADLVRHAVRVDRASLAVSQALFDGTVPRLGIPRVWPLETLVRVQYQCYGLHDVQLPHPNPHPHLAGAHSDWIVSE